MTAPVEREFVVLSRGEARELILATFREGLRNSIDPDTGALCTEDTVRRVTQAGSRFYNEADGIDLALMASGKRAEFLAQQISHDRASSAFLRTRHAPLWGESFLPGFSSSGTVAATGTPGTTWIGSTTLPDALATYGTDPAGKRYQVVTGGIADANGEATLSLASLDTGLEVNIPIGTVITWANAPGGSAPTATVNLADFTGGLPAETDEAFVARLGSRIRHKPASGNDAHFRSWARAASVSVEDAFIYPTAFHAGSVLVCITQKRGSTTGPFARQNVSSGVLAAVTNTLVPPGSAFVPPRVRVLVVRPQSRTTNPVLLLSLLKGSNSGWADVEPFPVSRGALASVQITSLSDQQNFSITAGSTGQLPGGVAGPLPGITIMGWNASTSRFVSLGTASVTDAGAGVYDVVLDSPPAGITLATGSFISPDTALRDSIAEGIEEYFDSLGPGEVVTLGTDARGVTAFRRPRPSEEYPARAGQTIVTFVSDAIQAAAADIQLDTISVSTPTVPTDPADGPELLTVNNVNVLPLD